MLIIGPCGSIGSELSRRMTRFHPEAIVLVERRENFLFEIDRGLGERWPELAIHPMIADACDGPRVRKLFERFRP